MYLPLSDILCLTAVRAAVVAKWRILGRSFLTLSVVLKVKLLVSVILSSIISSLHQFLLHHLVFLNQQEQVLIYGHLIYLLYFINCSNHLIYFLIYQCLIYLHHILNELNQLF